MPKASARRHPSQKPRQTVRKKAGQETGLNSGAKVPPSAGPMPKKSTADMAMLFDLVAADMTKVNGYILERLASPVALIPQIAGHIIAAGGKRLRPVLTLATAGGWGTHPAPRGATSLGTTPK